MLLDDGDTGVAKGGDSLLFSFRLMSPMLLLSSLRCALKDFLFFSDQCPFNR